MEDLGVPRENPPIVTAIYRASTALLSRCAMRFRWRGHRCGFRALTAFFSCLPCLRPRWPERNRPAPILRSRFPSTRC